jgi:hypothetical protein
MKRRWLSLIISLLVAGIFTRTPLLLRTSRRSRVSYTHQHDRDVCAGARWLARHRCARLSPLPRLASRSPHTQRASISGSICMASVWGWHRFLVTCLCARTSMNSTKHDRIKPSCIYPSILFIRPDQVWVGATVHPDPTWLGHFIGYCSTDSNTKLNRYWLSCTFH